MIQGGAKKWYVLYTKPRNELRAARSLDNMGIEVYVPTKTEVRQWSDRKKKIIIPLLPSMVLVHLLDKQFETVFEVSQVVRYLFENGKRASVSNQEILAMKSYLEDVPKLKLDGEKGLVVGDHVEVPLLQQSATVLSIKGKKCLAQLQKLGAVVSFQLE